MFTSRRTGAAANPLAALALRRARDSMDKGPASPTLSAMGALADAPGEAGPEGALGVIVELLCLVEAGRRFDAAQVPRATLGWFLDHAERFRPVAFAAVGLMGRIAGAGDDRLRVAVARALGGFLDVAPARAEALLMSLARGGSEVVQLAVEEVLAAQLRSVPGADADAILERWVDAGSGARELAGRAARRARATPPPSLLPR